MCKNLVQVIIKQEPGEVSPQQQQQQAVSTVTSQPQAGATASHQFVAVKGGHMISMSAQKQAAGATATTAGKVAVFADLQPLHRRRQRQLI